MAAIFQYCSTINLFLFKNIQFSGKNYILGNFYMIKKYVNLRTFSNPENQLADKNQLFPCLAATNVNRPNADRLKC